jgi:4-hydroxy-tetrahydrodipicolinate synthase
MSLGLAGIYAAIVTPFDQDDRPAPSQLKAHMRHLERKGCDGVLVCGTTGEAASLSVEERIEMFEAAHAAATGLKILAGTGAASLEDAVRLTRSAFDLEVNAVVVIPPYFHREVSFEGQCRFYELLLKRAVPADGQVLLYHNPIATVTHISFELITWLCDRFPDQVVGIKDSSSDLDHCLRLCRDFPQLKVFVGDDRLLGACLEAGGAGAITGLANIFADILSDVRREFENGRSFDAAQARLTDAHRLLDGLPRLPSIKMLLAKGGIIDREAVRPPLRPLTVEEIALLRQRFHLDAKLPASLDMADLSQTPLDS